METMKKTIGDENMGGMNAEGVSVDDRPCLEIYNDKWMMRCVQYTANSPCPLVGRDENSACLMIFDISWS